MTRSGSRTPFRWRWARRRSSPGTSPEQGGAAVEFALVLPILVLILFGIFDFGQAFLAQHGVSAAAREGARLAIAARPVTDTEVEARVQTYLDDANVVGAAISISPSATGAASGTSLTVAVTKSYTMTFVPLSFDLRGASTMVKE